MRLVMLIYALGASVLNIWATYLVLGDIFALTLTQAIGIYFIGNAIVTNPLQIKEYSMLCYRERALSILSQTVMYWFSYVLYSLFTYFVG